MLYNQLAPSGIFPHERRSRQPMQRRQTLGHNLLTDLVEFWPLSEQSSVRRGFHQGLNLADNNGALGADGVGSLASAFVSASSQKLTRASETATQVADQDFSVFAWVRPTTLTGYAGVIGKVAAGAYEWLMYYDNSTTRWAFLVSPIPSGTGWGIATSVTYGAAQTSQWAFLYGQHDSVGNTVKISVNAGALDSTAYTAGCNAGSAGLQIGQTNVAGEYFNGAIQRCGYFKRILTTDEITYLYNGGRGRDYPFV